MVPTSIKSILCDIEGTTTSISFVKETLFPYALEHVESYLKDNWEDESTKSVVDSLRKQSLDDIEAKLEGAVVIPENDNVTEQIETIVASVKWQMNKDRKASPLKNLQGLIWAKGYKDGTIKGHVYDDVAKAFDQWLLAGVKIYIYSSGSVDAQKLLFANTEHGDLLSKLSGHFDTQIGLKKEVDSYTKILKEIGSGAAETLFLTDIVDEAKAAKAADLNVVLVNRPGNAALSTDEQTQFTVVTSFETISLEMPSNKRKLVDEDIETEDRPTKVAKTDEDGIVETEPCIESITAASALPVVATEPNDHQQNGKTETHSNDATEDMQVDVEQEHNKTEILKTGDDITESTEAMQVDSDNATSTTVEEVVPNVEQSNGVGGDETDITATIEDCEKSKEIVIAVAKAEVKAEEITPTIEAIEKDVVDEAVVVVEKKLEEDMDIKKSEPKVENDGNDASASVLSNIKDCKSIEVVSNVETTTLIENITEESFDVPIIDEITVNPTDTSVVSENDSSVVAIEMTAAATTQKENGEPLEMKPVDEKDAAEKGLNEKVLDKKVVDIVKKEDPEIDSISEPAVTVMDTEPAPEVLLEKSNEVSAKDTVVTAVAPIEADIVAVSPVEDKPAEPTKILSNGGSIADEPKDVPIQVQHEVVLKSDALDDNTTTTATDSATTQMTEISEVVETNSNNSKEKVSRVEITIEQIDKQLGQTTQTTTHIVKEISITEQTVCGKKIASIPTDNKTEVSTNIDKKIESTEEKICSVEKEIESINPEAKVDSERGSHNGKCELPTNGIEKSENDSDKENDVETVSTNCEDKVESSSLTADTVMKKCPEAATSMTPAATPVEA